MEIGLPGGFRYERNTGRVMDAKGALVAILESDPTANELHFKLERDLPTEDLEGAVRAVRAVIDRLKPDSATVDVGVQPNYYLTELLDSLRRTGTIPWYRAGFVPVLDSEFDKDELLAMLRGQTVVRPIVALRTRQYAWFGATQRLERSMRDVSSFEPVVLANGQAMLFPSMRARTPMLQLRQKPFRVYRGPRSYPFIRVGSVVLIPISRYSEGMSRGLYHKEAVTTAYCGTFYYFEPESEVFLSVEKDRLMYAKNKIAAAQILKREPALKQTSLPSDLEHESTCSAAYYAEALQLKDDDTGPSPESRVIRWSLGQDNALPLTDALIGPNGRYLEAAYAKEDRLDQSICQAAKAVGIDVVFLSAMPGKTRAVSELLDTRPREESLKSLVWTAA